MKYLTVIIAAILLNFPAVQAQEVVELHQPASEKVIVKLMFTNGAICDPPQKEGLTYLTANVIADGGTQDMTKSEIDDFIYPMAANYGVSVDKEVSVFTFAFPRDFAEDFYKVIKGLILEPAMSESDFRRIKANQENFVNRVVKNSNDEDYSKVVLEQYLFDGTNYAHMKQGNASSVANLTLEDVKAHYQRYFTRDNLMIGIGGNYSHSFKQRLEQDMQQLPGMEAELPEPGNARMPDGYEVKMVTKDAFGSAIYMGYPLDITRANDDFAALMVANSYLGEHRKSYGQLYQQIRSTRSMNYGDYSYIEWYPQGSRYQLPQSGYPRQSNYFSIWIRPVQTAAKLREAHEGLSDVEIGHAYFAMRTAIREYEQLVENGISEENFEITRQFLRSYIKLYIKSPDERLGYLMDSRVKGLSLINT
jgi:zinc protease